MSEPNEPELAGMRLPSPEEREREREAAKEVAKNPSFMAAAKKLARNTLRTSPRGLDPVYTRKTHPGLGPPPPEGSPAPAAPVSSATSAAVDGLAESDRITPYERRKLIVGFGSILIAINLIGIVIWLGISYVGRAPDPVITPGSTQSAPVQGSTSAPVASTDRSVPTSATGSTAEPAQSAPPIPTDTATTTRTSEPATTLTGTATTSESSSTTAPSARPTTTGTAGIWMMEDGGKP